MNPEPQIFVYKMTVDNGGAPCVQHGLISLAICKPRIRRKATEGDWIIGFGGKMLGEGFIYMARVTGTVEHGRYYQKRQYAKRPDCIYRFRGGELIRKKSAAYHADPGNMAKDVGGAPEYQNARVLLSSDYRYFGGQLEAIPKPLQAFADSMRRNHRVNLDSTTHEALLSLITTLCLKHAGRRKVGKPQAKPDASVSCNRDEGFAECSNSLVPN